MKVVKKYSPTIKYQFDDWWIKVIKLQNQFELVFCQENEADEFHFDNGHISFVHNDKRQYCLSVGDKRDSDSYFLTLYPLHLLQLSLDVKFINILNN